jgi:hypothetical protein
LTASVSVDNYPFMSRAAATNDDVVSLDEYRRARGDRSMSAAAAPMRAPARLAPVAAPVWVYWVPVWIW